MSDTATVTPWTTATPYATGFPSWVPEEDQERIQAYTVYNNFYWSEDRNVEVLRRAEDGQPLYVPKPKVIADTTAQYLLKGLQILLTDADKHPDQAKFLQDFLDRESFLAKFNVAKLKGVVLGDWLLHVTADPDLPDGRKISITTVDPGAYFPEFDPDDQETRTGVKLVEQWADPNDPSKTLVKILRYFYNPDEPSDTRIWREENIWEVDGWNNPKKAKLYKALLPLEALPSTITEIPVYHFKNADWDGFLFGNSEFKGVERVFKGIDQAISDEEMALALVGLGVYATDAGRPVRNGHEVDWEIVPGTVLEVPGATMIKRLEGISSVTPIHDFLDYMDATLFQATQTSDIALGNIDPSVAESGIALAIKFLPTAAKLEYRDQAGLGKLKQLWYDMRFWFKEYEGIDFDALEIVPTIGDKLPVNRAKVMDELNNLFDRNIISAEFYRAEMTRLLGYVFPSDIATQILNEKRMQMELMQEFAPKPDAGGDTVDKGNQSNNKSKVNESAGTEAGSSK